MNTETLISVVVPCYNIASYIESCARSILGQTHTNIEVLLVDDGSTDDTAALLNHLAEEDRRIHVIHKANGGVTSARLEGIRAALGEWIGFVDGDDIIESDMYAHLLKNALDHGADISHCGYQMVFPSRVEYYYNTGCLEEQDRQSGLQDLIAGSRIEPGLCNKLFHKNLFHSLLHSDVMDSTIRNFEDLLMNFYLFREAKLSIYEDFCPYHYMVRQESAATSKLNEHKLCDPLRVMKRIREETLDNSALQKTVNSRIAGILTGIATMPLDDQTKLIHPHRENARKELRQMIPMLWKGGYSKRTRILSTWAAIWPWSYTAVHQLYAKARGTDRKYEIS